MKTKILDTDNLINFLEANSIKFSYTEAFRIKILEDLDLNDYDIINIPNVIKAKNIYAMNAHSFSALDLQESHIIEVMSSNRVHLPSLIKSDSIFANNAEYLNIPLLKSSGILHLSNKIADKKIENNLYSAVLGSRKSVSMFNVNTKMIKIGCQNFMYLNEAKKNISNSYPKNHRHYKEYMSFIKTCELQ